jgi:hypothetical protein
MSPFAALLSEIQSKIQVSPQQLSFLDDLSSNLALANSFDAGRWSVALDVALGVTPISLLNTKSFHSKGVNRVNILEV